MVGLSGPLRHRVSRVRAEFSASISWAAFRALGSGMRGPVLESALCRYSALSALGALLASWDRALTSSATRRANLTLVAREEGGEFSPKSGRGALRGAWLLHAMGRMFQGVADGEQAAHGLGVAVVVFGARGSVLSTYSSLSAVLAIVGSAHPPDRGGLVFVALPVLPDFEGSLCMPCWIGPIWWMFWCSLVVLVLVASGSVGSVLRHRLALSALLWQHPRPCFGCVLRVWCIRPNWCLSAV
jgi:hypothetical protein